MNTANEIKIAALKSEIEIGVKDFVHGRFQTYNDTNLMQLANEISQRGRIQFNALRLKAAAKVHKKK